MSHAYDLCRLGPTAFQQMVCALALKVLGAGSTGFGPGPDGGRDVYFYGEAPYPSATERWKGTWYLQSKFLDPRPGVDPHQWLREEVEKELQKFGSTSSRRVWPDIWIVATNVDPSGVAETGSFDRTRALVAARRPNLADRFHIWGGRKILDLLREHPAVARSYGHFLTSGDVLAALRDQLQEERATAERIIWHLVVGQMVEQQFGRLEQAGGESGWQPEMHRLFVDLPIRWGEMHGLALRSLLTASAAAHRHSIYRTLKGEEWASWLLHPERAGTWFVRGGPGQGKSTLGQYFAQVQRAAIVLADQELNRSIQQEQLAAEIRRQAEDLWPETPRIPLTIELKEYARWTGERRPRESRGILNYLAEQLTTALRQPVLEGTLMNALRAGSWFVVFDGLDEVPQDVKDTVAAEVRHFLEKDAVELDADILVYCTSRPQGYSGQFDKLHCVPITLPLLSEEEALQCAYPVLSFQRTRDDALRYAETLRRAMRNVSVRALMTTPLQAHIMAIVVREGGRPPERRWQLFKNFYEVIRRREGNHELPNKELVELLNEKLQLLKSVHNRLGFALHMRAERSDGAQTHMNKDDFGQLVATVVTEMADDERELIVKTVMSATTERLVLVNTPDNGDHVRFDVRQLQEFFAAEFLYEDASHDSLGSRIELLDGDSHWREVLHFLLSAVVETRRQMELSVAIDALEHFDSGDDPSTAFLDRRFCRGSMAVVRLLEEGVLEQDKRVRLRFRKALSTAFGSTELAVLRPFTRVHRPSSRNWLLDEMVYTLHEALPSERVGAAILLTLMLDDGDTRVARISPFFEKIDLRYLALVVRRANELATSGAGSYSFWFLELLCRLLQGSRWTTMNTDAITSVLGALSIQPARTVVACANLGWPERDRALLTWLLEDMDVPGEPGANEHLYFARGGWVGLRGVSVDVGGAEPLSWLLGSLLHTIARLVAERTPAAFRAVVAVLAIVPERAVRAIPHQIVGLVPVQWSLPLRPQLSSLAAASDDELESILSGQALDGRVVTSFPTTPEVIHSDGVRDAMDLLPSSDLPASAIAEKFVSALLSSPADLLAAPGRWGVLIAELPHRERAVREALREASKGPVSPTARAIQFSPFRIALPEEASLLPHLIPSILANDDLHRIGGALSAAGLHSAALRDLVEDRSQSQDVRLAAYVLVWIHMIHAASDPTLVERAMSRLRAVFRIDAARASEPLVPQEFLKDVTPPVPSWFVAAVVTCTSLVGLSTISRRTLSAVLEWIRDDYDVRDAFDPLLEAWREHSVAPISTAGVGPAWLGLTLSDER